VDVGAQARVVGEIPAGVVGIVIDHDVIASPIPVTDVAQVERGDAEVETAKPETAWIAALNVPPVSSAEAAFEVAMLPRMIEVEAGIISTVIVPDPFAAVVDVRGFGVPRLIAKGGAWRCFRSLRFLVLRFLVRRVFRAGHCAMRRRRTMLGNVSAAYGMAAALMFIVLRQRWHRKHHACAITMGEVS
jgi:hypothetical protein